MQVSRKKRKEKRIPLISKHVVPRARMNDSHLLSPERTHPLFIFLVDFGFFFLFFLLLSAPLYSMPPSHPAPTVRSTR
ncbi:hypothetical protein BDV25DRAFT_165051 [Aspergillus avenaceus]|uniref:Transmembrane protein n=1 Tax=Aspergillus avenaceus TaxID=36643 RepID=A0A5N6TGB4_ASPAV|nr:hypothetical protein BDV25DRAFT_165051 [Aspergillus avenaceus]